MTVRKHSFSRNRRFGAGSLLWLLLICSLVISTGACSKQSPTALPAPATPGAPAGPTAAVADGSAPVAQPTAAAQPLPAQPEVDSSGGGVITFATYAFLDEVYKPILEEFHRQYPTITVQVREMPATLDTREIASAADTSLLMFRPQTGGSHFLDLAPFEAADPTFAPGSFWPGVLEACQDGAGRAYGLPVFVEPTGIYYREQAFKDAGLPLPGPGWTWEDFQKAVITLSGTAEGQRVYGFADDSFLDTPDETLLSPRISALLAQTNGSIDVDLFEKELQWYLNLVQNGGLYSQNIYPQQSPAYAPGNGEAWSAAWNKLWSASHEMFVKHPPAMWKGRLLQVYWADADMKALPDGSLNMSAASGPIIQSKTGIGWAPFPVSAAGQNDGTTPNTVTCAAISAGTRHPRAAWTWLSFLASHPILPDWSLEAPSQPAAAESSGYWRKIPEALREPVQFGLEHGWYSNPHPAAVLAVNQALLKAIAENVPFRAALVDASQKIETATQPAPDTGPIVVAPPAPTISPGATKIAYGSFFFEGNDRVKELAKAFHALRPDISVEVAAATGMQSAQELAGAYDCFSWVPRNDLPADLLYDLNQFLVTGQEDMANDFEPGALEEFSQEGKLLGLPAAYRPNLIYYNADLLAQRGLNPPSADWTYADFIEMMTSAASAAAASAAAASAAAPEPTYGLALEYPSPDLDLFLAGQNARLVDASGEVPAYRFDTVDTAGAVQWLAEQVKTNIILPVTPTAIGKHPDNLMDARRLILDGRVAFWMSFYDQDRGSSYALQEAAFPIGVAPLPIPGGRVAWGPNHLLIGQYISRQVENPQVPLACWEWIKYLSEQPESSLGIPARRSVRQSEGWVGKVGRETALVYQAALEQRPVPAREYAYALGPTRDWWNALLAEVVTGAAPAPLLAEIQRKADAYTTCLAASSGYLSGDAQQRAQAVTDCASRAK